MTHSIETTTAAILLAGVLSGGLTWLLMRLARRLRLESAPREDRWHRTTTPSSGGIAVFLACAAVYLATGGRLHAHVACAAAFVALLGFVDDLLHLKPAVKFAGQALAALAVILPGAAYAPTPWPAVNLAFCFLWIVGLTNAFNLIDNMDGLCAGAIVIISGFRFGLLWSEGRGGDAVLFGIIGGAFAGFLVFNYRPARIFMGDCGSMFAGFTLASLTLVSPSPHTKVFLAGVFYPALTFTYPIFDTVLVSVLRKLAGRPVSTGGRDHSSHRLAGIGLGEGYAVWLLWLLTAAGSWVGLLAAWMSPAVLAVAALLVASVTVFGIFLASLPPYSVSLDTIPAEKWLRRRVPTLRAGLILVVDTLLAALALFIAFLLRFESGLGAEQTRNLMMALPVVAACHAAFACLDRTFNISWRLIDFGDAGRLARPVVTGAALSLFVLWCLGVEHFSRAVMLLYCLLAFSFAVGLRASLRLLRDLEPQTQGRKIAILGADAHGEMLVNLLRKMEGLSMRPVVFFDADRGRDGMRVHGLPVRHCGANVVELCAQFDVKDVVAPAGALDNGGRDLARKCVEAGLNLMALDVSLRQVR